MDDRGTGVSGFDGGKPDSRGWRKQWGTGMEIASCEKLGWERSERRGGQVERRLVLCFKMEMIFNMFLY